MRLLTLFGLMLIIAGIMLIISSLLKPIVIGGGYSGEVTGCIILFFIPICFSSKSTLAWLPSVFGIVALVIVTVAIIVILLRLLGSTRSFEPT